MPRVMLSFPALNLALVGQLVICLGLLVALLTRTLNLGFDWTSMFGVWGFMSATCIVLINHIGNIGPGGSSIPGSAATRILFGACFLGVLSHNLFVIATVYYNWTYQLIPEVQVLQLFPTILCNLHSYFQMHYLMRPHHEQSDNVLFKRMSFFYNLIMLIHLGQFRTEYYISNSSVTLASTLTFIKAILMILVLVYRLVALYCFLEFPIERDSFTTAEPASTSFQQHSELVISNVLLTKQYHPLTISRRQATLTRTSTASIADGYEYYMQECTDNQELVVPKERLSGTRSTTSSSVLVC